MQEQASTVLWDVAQEHLDEAEFLVEAWLAAMRSPRLSMALVQRTSEHRLLAHLDGLAVGGPPVADELLWPTLADETEGPPARIAAAALALLSDPGLKAEDRLLDVLGKSKNPQVRDGLGQAFQIVPRADVDEKLRLALYATEAAEAQAILLEVLAARRTNPGPILGTLLQRGDPRIVAAALDAAAAAGADRPRLQRLVEGYLTHGPAPVQAAALRTCLVWNVAAAWRACGMRARSGSPEALLFVGLFGGPRELLLVTEALRSADHRQAALFALGFSGRVEAVEACLPFLDDKDPKVAALASEAVGSITGLPLEDPPYGLPSENLEASDDDDALPPLEEDLRSDLSPSPDDELPRANAAEVRRWWAAQQRQFAAGQRYINGVAATPASLSAAMMDGSIRRTGPLLYDAAVRSGGQRLLPALRLQYPRPSLSADLAPQREPAWR